MPAYYIELTDTQCRRYVSLRAATTLRDGGWRSRTYTIYGRVRTSVGTAYPPTPGRGPHRWDRLTFLIGPMRSVWDTALGLPDPPQRSAQVRTRGPASQRIIGGPASPSRPQNSAPLGLPPMSTPICSRSSSSVSQYSSAGAVVTRTQPAHRRLSSHPSAPLAGASLSSLAPSS